MKNLIKIADNIKQENGFVSFSKKKQSISQKILNKQSDSTSFEGFINGLKNDSKINVIPITYTKCGNLVFALQNDKVLSAYWYGKRPLKSESKNDYALMSRILFWVGYKNTDIAIQYFLESPYVQQKDECCIDKILNTNYLECIVNEITSSKKLEVV